MKFRQERWRSKVLWVAVISLILLVMKDFFKLDISDAEPISELMLTILIGIGIINDPTNKEGL